MSKHPLKGSERTPLAGAKIVGKARPDERLEVTILIRARSNEALSSRAHELAVGTRPNEHFRREDFAQRFGSDPDDIAAIKRFAQDHGIAVVEENAARRTVILSGTVAQFNTAFDVDLQRFEHSGGSYRGRSGAVHIPDALNGIVEAVLGLDNRPQVKPHFRARPMQGNVRWRAFADASTSFTPLQLASLYDFPRGDGRGECIGIIELGGGYRTADVQAYFSELNIRPPRIVSVCVDHGNNAPTGDPNGPDGEVMLDLEVAGAIAPGASIAVYFAPNTDAGFFNHSPRQFTIASISLQYSRSVGEGLNPLGQHRPCKPSIALSRRRPRWALRYAPHPAITAQTTASTTEEATWISPLQAHLS